MDHYIKVIKKRANAASIKSVSLLIDEAIEKSNSKKTISYEVNPGIETTVDPEIGALADQIALDPLLFKNKINLVNQFGVVGE